MRQMGKLLIVLAVAGLVACGAQTTSLQLGASYDELQFQGNGGTGVSASLTDCQGGSCQLMGSAYGTGAMQSSGQFSLTSASNPAMTLSALRSGTYSVTQATPWSFLYSTSAGSLTGALNLTSAQDSSGGGTVTVQGTLNNLGGTLATAMGSAATVVLQIYDGAGLAPLLGNTGTQSGSLAPGSQLSPSTTLAGAPASTGAGRSGSATPALDSYGGLADVTIGTGTGYFQVKKLGARWVFVDPQGHPFWMLGVFAVDLNTDTSAGSAYTLAKYGGLAQWGIQAVRRLRSWGFNSTAEYSSAYVVPVNQDGSFETTDPMPWVGIVRPAYYSLRDSGGYAPQPVKDLVNGMDAVYTNYRGDTLPDVFDPDFATYAEAYVAAHTSAAEASSPWLIGTASDDLDDLWGFGPGPDLLAARTSSNIGWLTLCTDFQQLANTTLGLVYSDTAVYSKYALANWLEAKYGSIQALNQAWGATYTTFGDAGGYGTGTGLLDEDGRDPWVGSDDVALSGAHPQVRSDLNAFLAVFADKYFSIVSAAIRQSLPHQLVFGPCTLNSWGGVSRAPILAAAAQYTDVVQASMGSQAVYDASLTAAGDHPFVAWTGMPANPDSDLAAFANPDSPGVYTTQAARGAAYAAQVQADFDWSGSSAAGALAGSENVVGSKFWAWTDSWGERTNWGLVTFLDNPYDGVADIVASGTDAWGYASGGEASDYGNFLEPATQANLQVLSDLQTATQP